MPLPPNTPATASRDRQEGAGDAMLFRAVKLMAVATDLTALSDPGEVPAQVVAHLSGELHFQAVSVLLLDAGSGRLEYAADYGVPAEVKALGFRTDGITLRVMNQGTPLFVEDMALDPHVNPNARSFFRSYACLPIAYRDRRLGVLIVNYGEAHSFEETERQILRAFASATAVALDKLHLMEEVRRHAEELERTNLALAATNEALVNARGELRILRGFIPICMRCKRIRSDEGTWTQLESYISAHSEARFSHGYCPECNAVAQVELRRELDSLGDDRSRRASGGEPPAPAE